MNDYRYTRRRLLSMLRTLRRASPDAATLDLIDDYQKRLAELRASRHTYL